MDEPTNHLDITSKELLKKALLEYDGSLIVVSHDREFLQGLTEKVYEFKSQNIKEYHGDINTFLSERSFDNFKQLEASQKDQKIIEKDKKTETNNFLEQKNIKRRINKLKKEIIKLERKISSLSSILKEKNEVLSDPIKFKDLSNDKEFFQMYDEQMKKLKFLENEWTTKNEELDSIT